MKIAIGIISPNPRLPSNWTNRCYDMFNNFQDTWKNLLDIPWEMKKNTALFQERKRTKTIDIQAPWLIPLLADAKNFNLITNLINTYVDLMKESVLLDSAEIGDHKTSKQHHPHCFFVWLSEPSADPAMVFRELSGWNICVGNASH